jgi:hypothetical protein
MGGHWIKIRDGIKRGWTAVVTLLPPKARKPTGWVAGLLLFYTLFGFLILPFIVRAVAVKQLSRQFDREVSIRQVRMNPYVLSATVRGLVIKDKDGEPFISWDEVYVNLQLSSLVRKPWVFTEIHALQPYVRAQVNKDRTLNFSDLLKKFSTGPTNAAPKRPLYVEIEQFKIAGARASLTDLSPSTPFRRVVGPLELTLTHFHTDPTSRNPYAFSGTTDSGEQFSWSGYFFLDPLRSAGEISLGGLSLPKYAPLYQDLVRFEIRDGVIAGRATYQFAMTHSNYVASVTNASFSLQSFKFGAPDATNNVLELESLAVTGVAADAVARTLEAGNIAVKGGYLAVQRERDESVNLINLSLPSATATNAPGGILVLLQAATNAFAALLGSTNLWSATLDQIDVTNCGVHLVDLANSRPVRLDLDDISLAAQHFSNVPGSNQTATLALRWNTNGTVRIGTVVQIAPPSAEVTLDINNLELRPLDPYLEPFVNLFILDSKVSLDGEIRMQMGTNNLPEVSFNGNGRMDDFSSVDSLTTEDLVKWKSLSLSGVDATLTPPVVTVRQIDFVEPVANVVFETNNTLNVMTVLKVTATNAMAAPDTAIAASAAPAKKQSLGQRLGAVLRQVLAGNTNAAGQAASPRIAVGTLAISNGVVVFNDRSLQPAVKVTVQDIDGTLADISTDELKRADVHLTAKVGGTGPIELTGKINPLSQQAPTELKAVFKNVEMTPASPYSGKFLGYRLNRGKLGMDINYQVSQRHLTAKNVITVDYLTLGEKVNSPDATHLPVRLAVALLKDRNGKIELNVPVEGNLDDPQFHFGKVITRVIVNLFTKIVTSPFAALGALFGGKGEEVSYQDFQPGSAELQAANVEKLDALAKGLYERPGLQLEIESGFDPIADRDALRKRKLVLSFRQQKWTSLRKSEQAQLKPEQVPLSPEEYAGYLRAAYSAANQAGVVSNLASVAAAPERATTRPKGARPNQTAKMTATEKGATALMKQAEATPVAEPDAMERTVLETVKITDDDLNQLATRRAKVLQQRLLETGKIEAERISLAATESSTNRTARVYFHLQ